MNNEKYRQGMVMRRAVLGDAYVDRAINAATDFNQPLQDMITENCWGEVWTRPALSAQTRSLITIATLAALKASSELKVHVRGALRNGCSAAEIQEVLLQSTVYCGVPSGIEAFTAAKEAIDTWNVENPDI
ncbi:4-carboxymuconolactone decarboxylase [Reinekea sp.]|jgi:4-carboxymuconolactone decarboxylase|uniref:4-carboxymuconolactone decarboxylase n=1 Tax=Reinekea sp. TaxID=1970455 RepID=UPI002A81AE9E|nr:4-carboxymuconolactone decarboxylase [Reinekea sp.]